MIKIIRLSGLACAVLCTHAAYADTPTPDAHRVEVLATMLTAYVSCDRKSELQRDVKDEIQAYDATPEEAKSALLTLSGDMMACAPLRKYAATLAEMADTDAETL